LESQSLATLLLISALAFAVPLLTARIPGGVVPIVVLEIVFGMFFGRAGLGWVEHHDWLEFLSLFGFAFLMFLSGLEVDVRMLSRAGPARREGAARITDNPLAAGLLIFAGTLVLAVLAVRVIMGEKPLAHALLAGLVLSTTSVGIVMPTLKERGLSPRPLGQAILMAAVVSDFATMFLITILAGVLSSRDLLELPLILALFAAFFVFIALGRRPALRAFAAAAIGRMRHSTAQLDVRGALALLLLFVVLAQTVQAELVLAAFLAGAAISAVSSADSHVLRAKLDAIGYGFFIPIFFFTVGAKFNLQALLDPGVLLVPVLVLVAFAVKVIPALILRASYTWRESLGAGALLSARLSLIIAASAIGMRLGVIDEATNAALIVVAVVTCIASPVLFNLLLPASRLPRAPSTDEMLTGKG
jgi:Kef-type K+ transport system membrane component KefB